MDASVLWGRDHVAYGDVAVERPAPGVALALTRGRLPKPYRWTDPNEDVVAAVVGERATLLVVADAHNGTAASEVAVRTVLDALGDDPPPALADDRLVGLFDDAGRAVLARARTLDGEHRESRTTLSVALIAGDAIRGAARDGAAPPARRLQWAAMGDSPVLVISGAGGAAVGRELTVGDHRFVGWPMRRVDVDRHLQRGRVALPADAWVAVVSDGFSNFTRGRAAATVAADVLAGARDGARGGAPDAAAGALGLVERACAGGAGDNVAAAVVAPGDGTGRG